MRYRRVAEVARRLAAVVAIVFLGAGNAAAVRADPSGGSEAADKPWYRGVSPADQDLARRLYQEGVQFHGQRDYPRAIEKYRAALVHWDHPDIHYNIARAQISLNRPIEAYRSLRAATRYGPVSLPPENWKTAQEYLVLLEGRIGTITVTCELPGVRVSINDKPFFAGAGTHEKLVLPGGYRIVASKEGHLDAEKWIQVNPGERVSVELAPVALGRIAMARVTCTEAEATVYLDNKQITRCPGEQSAVLIPGVRYTLTITRPGRITTQRTVVAGPGQNLEVALRTTSVAPIVTRRRWRRWKPWAVVGAGAVAGMAGGAMEWRAVSNMNQYDRSVEALCGLTGCLSDDVPELSARRRRAQMQSQVGVALLIAGSAALVTGVTLAFFNQPRSFRPAVYQRESPSGLAVVPTLTAEWVGVSAALAF